MGEQQGEHDKCHDRQRLDGRAASRDLPHHGACTQDQSHAAIMAIHGVAICKTAHSRVGGKIATLWAVPRQRLTARQAEIRRLVADQVRQLRALRPAGQQTQAWLASQMGQSADKSAVVRLERGDKPITLDLIEQLAQAFGLHPIEFLTAGPHAVWPTTDQERRIAALQERALEEAEAVIGRIRNQFAEDCVSALMVQAGDLSQQLADLAGRLNLIRHQVTVDKLNRELAEQDRERRRGRALLARDRQGRAEGRSGRRPPKLS